MPGNRSKSRRLLDPDDGPATEDDEQNAPLFQPFRWTDPKTDHLQIEARPLNQLIEKVIDVTDGVRAVMCVLERDGYSREDDAPPLLDSVRQGALRRLGITSLLLLSDEATRLGDWVQVRYEQQRLEPRRSGKRKRSKFA
ncbi:hypothetical protein [Rhizobacter sp. OV335]|uniref:hypothetical protein n=1 Tax=Rhizobacter sp. OV335 TaxID=1500264 RepID=UPI00093666FA|nr:hypothetical protein [Rhizobacter sp. OV335]